MPSCLQVREAGGGESARGSPLSRPPAVVGCPPLPGRPSAPDGAALLYTSEAGTAEQRALSQHCQA
jgi:hypothetical protein